MNCGTRLGYGQHKSKNEPACFWCKEWHRKDQEGSVVVAPIKAPKKPKVRTPRKQAVCGTTEGFSAHQYYGTETCDPCREAWNERNRERYAERKGKQPAPRAKRTDPIEHGTAKGRGQHKRRGEEVCTPCREAYNAANAAARAARLAAQGKVFTPKVVECGTLAGCRDHRRKGEPTCQPCRESNRQAKAEYRERTGNR